jgi:molybdenum cofactor biosynthesis enzyme MoaA
VPVSRTRKQPYRKSRRFDATCRCNGSCSYCMHNRLHQQIKALSGVQAQLKEIA